MKLEHVAINVEDPQEMAAWYAKNLDMQIVVANDNPPYMHFLADKDGLSMIEIYNNSEAGVPDYGSIHPLTLHFAFSVTDIEATHQRLIEAGATADGEIATTPRGDKLAFLRDPWQITVQLVQRSTPLL